MSKATAMAKAVPKAVAKAKAKAKAKCVPLCNRRRRASTDDSDDDSDDEAAPWPPPGPEGLDDNIVDNDMVLRAFRAGIFRNGLYQVMDLTDIVRQHAMEAAQVSDRYRARISTCMPHHPPGYTDFMLTQTAVQSLKAACDGLGRLLNSVGMPPVRDWARVR